MRYDDDPYMKDRPGDGSSGNQSDRLRRPQPRGIYTSTRTSPGDRPASEPSSHTRSRYTDDSNRRPTSTGRPPTYRQYASQGHSAAPSHRAAVQKKNAPIWQLVVMDISLICVGLLVFAYFHHVRPVKGMQSGTVLPTPPSTVTTTAAPSAEESLNPQASLDPTATLSPDGTPAPEETPAPQIDTSGMWGAKFADKFTTGDIIKTENSYQSANVNIQIDQVQRDGITYYVADIYLRDIQYFKTAFAEDTFGRNRDETVNIANNHNAILAISGDYCGMRNEGIVIRNGELFRESQDSMDVLVMYHDGTMQTYSPGQLDMDTIKSTGAYQAWDFGPMLLNNGQVMTEFNSNLNPKNPRSAIGYYEPGHYCLVVVDGRQEGYSVGMTLQEMSQMFYDLGCTVAYNLDGGQSAVMAYDGQVHSQPYGGGRSISDIIYIAE